MKPITVEQCFSCFHRVIEDNGKNRGQDISYCNKKDLEVITLVKGTKCDNYLPENYWKGELE